MLTLKYFQQALGENSDSVGNRMVPRTIIEKTGMSRISLEILGFRSTHTCSYQWVKHLIGEEECGGRG